MGDPVAILATTTIQLNGDSGLGSALVFAFANPVARVCASPNSMARCCCTAWNAAAAQGMLDARAAHPNASLADLYDPLTMPPNLVKAHQVLDAAVDTAYGRKGFRNDAERVAFLFERYQKYTSLLPTTPAKRRSNGIYA